MQSINGATVFVFFGSVSPWSGQTFAAVRKLLTFNSQFRDGMTRCDEAFAEFVDRSLIEVVHGGINDLDPARRDVWQPVHFAVMVSLATQWRAAGVTPDAVIGQSYGEIAAAHVAGALTLREAAKLVALSANRIAEARTPDRPDFEALREAFLNELTGLRPHTVDTVFISTVTGAALDTAILDGEYWFANLRQPPLTEHAVRWAYEHGYQVFVDSSIDPALSGGIRDWLERYEGRQDSGSASARAICPSRPSDFAMSRYRPNSAR